MKALIFLLLPMLLFAQNGDFPATQPQNPNQTISQTQDQPPANDSYRWSFGIFYIPYYSGEVYSGEIYEYGNGLYSLFSVSKSMTLMEGQFSYSFTFQICWNPANVNGLLRLCIRANHHSY